jgi:hypothetical protein
VPHALTHRAYSRPQATQNGENGSLAKALLPGDFVADVDKVVLARRKRVFNATKMLSASFSWRPIEKERPPESANVTAVTFSEQERVGRAGQARTALYKRDFVSCSRFLQSCNLRWSTSIFISFP